MFLPPSPTTNLLQIISNIELHSSVTSQQEIEVKQLLAKDADLAVKTEGNGNTVLMVAILYGSESFVMELINLIKNVATLNQPDHNVDAFNTPLLLAIKRGMYDAAILLVERGVELDYVSRKGFTSLHYACGTLGIESKNNDDSKDMQLIKLIHNMLDKGADPRMLTCFNSTPLDLLKCLPSQLDFRLVQESQPYRIARVLNVSPELAKSWCDLNNSGNSKALQQPVFNKINNLYARYLEFNIKIDNRTSDNEINKIHEEYQAELDAFHDFANKTIYSVGMIIKRHLYGAHKSHHIYDLIDKGIFEFIRRGVKEPDTDDFSTIVDNIAWHRSGKSKDLLKMQITNGRLDFFKKHLTDLKQLEEHMQKCIEEHNTSAPAHSIKQMP